MDLFVTVLLTWLVQQAACHPTTNLDCSHLTARIDFDTHKATCLNATYHQSGDFTLEGPTGAVVNRISFHEVHASIAYAEGAELVFALWLPDKDSYDSRFLAVGNGGYGGTIDRVNMLHQLNSGLGFAVAGGDAGHDAWAETNGTDAGTPGLYIPFLNHQERVKAWIHDAISIFTPLAKAMVKVAYGKKPQHAYFNGCSAGGAQGFALAEFHPDLYDGIVAGSPANFQSHMWLSILWTFQAQQGAGALSADVLSFVTSAVLELCDGLDGVEDGVVENPLACPFDVEALACDNEEPTDDGGNIKCLTVDQVRAFKAVYAGPKTVDTSDQIFPGFSPGAEINWIIPVLVGLADGFSVPILQNLIYKDLDWDPDSFGYTAAEVREIDERGGAITNAIGSDLSDFRNRGGKILSTMGWADPAVAPLSAIEHRQRLKDALASAAEDIGSFYRLFMVPGGGHCSAAHFPQTPAEWHVMAPLLAWVEDGVRPESVLATDPTDRSGRTRRLCPWPATAALVGSDEDDWESFKCRVEE